MRVAVITPYHIEPREMLKRAHDSVITQTHACTHYMVADGHARAEIDQWNVRHIPLPTEHSNNGNTPRAIGSMDAIGDNFDAIAYLDADNWFDPDHIANLVRIHKETGADLVSSGRVIHAIDGSVLLPNGETGDGERHVDTSALMFTKAAHPLLHLWGTMPNDLGPKCDYFVFKGSQALGCTHAHSAETTLHFTSRYAPHYRAAGRQVPDAATAMHDMKNADQFARRLGARGLSHILSGKSVSNWFSQKKKHPLIIFMIGSEATSSEKERSLLEKLREKWGHEIKIRYASAHSILTEAEHTKTHNNVFLIVSEGEVADPDTVDKIAESRGDIAVIYLRNGSSKSIEDAESVLDRRAWKILLPSNEHVAFYRQKCRYGSGHTLVAHPSSAFEELSNFMVSYAR